ncbi:unnamed protein product, partial [Amoebophrya sp. A25]|eukprot:GSA25T00002886001.1
MLIHAIKRPTARGTTCWQAFPVFLVCQFPKELLWRKNADLPISDEEDKAMSAVAKDQAKRLKSPVFDQPLFN